MSVPPKISICAKDCAITSVQCYNDRADITRAIPSTLPRGTSSIYLYELVDSMDPHSVRVKGNKFVQILEVTQDRINNETNSQPTRSELRTQQDKKKEVQAKIAVTNSDLTRLEQKKLLTQSFADGSFQRVEKCPGKSLEEAKDIMAWYATELQTFATEKVTLENQAEDLRTQLSVIDADIYKLNGADGAKVNYMRTVTVLVDAQDFQPSEEFPECPPLRLTYIVGNASWTPSYDVRINSEKNSMQLVYFAEVKQFSGEDWSDVNLTLSTANPGVGSTPTPLRDTTVKQFFRTYGYENGASKLDAKKIKAFVSAAPRAQQNYFQSKNAGGRGYESAEENDLADDDNGSDLNLFGEEATLKAVSTYTAGFSIPRKCTIDSDNMSHKVVIADLSLSPEIMHYCAPSTTDVNVYLQSKTKNTSSYELLQSNKVSVFLDDAFVAISGLKHCSPASNFYLYLGVDSNVHCAFNPVDLQDTKTWGIVSSTKTKNFSFLTLISNNKKKPVKILIADTLPKSADSRIVVEIQDPKPSSILKVNGTFSPNAGMASLDSANLAKESGVFKDELGQVLIWICTVRPKEKKPIALKYQVNYPTDINIEIAKA